MKPWCVYETAWVLGPFTAVLAPGRMSFQATDYKKSVIEQRNYSHIHEQTAILNKSKRATNQVLSLRLQKQKQVTSCDPCSQHHQGAWGGAYHLSFLPALTKGIISPPFLGGAGTHTSFSVSPYCSKSPNKAFLEIPLWFHNYFYLRAPGSRLKTCVLVTQSCQTLCDPRDCTLPRSSVRGIL